MGNGLFLYDRIIEVTADYLGPAANRFIDRQIQYHLKKPPQDLKKEDLKNLIDWIRASISILTDDGDLVSEYTNRLETLSNDTKRAA